MLIPQLGFAVLAFFFTYCHAWSDTPKNAQTVAIIHDGPSEFADELEFLVRAELMKLMHDSAPVRFKRDEYNANWDIDKIEELVHRAMTAPDVDCVLVPGKLGTFRVMQLSADFDKPIVGGLVQDGGFSEFPYNNNRVSTRPNLTFVISPVRSLRDLQTFKRLCAPETIHIPRRNDRIDDSGIFFVVAISKPRSGCSSGSRRCGRS